MHDVTAGEFANVVRRDEDRAKTASREDEETKRLQLPPREHGE